MKRLKELMFNVRWRYQRLSCSSHMEIPCRNDEGCIKCATYSQYRPRPGHYMMYTREEL